jgi:3,4-dihydroxy 2-butanone 4-phosphate synthase/GTP cyclohydrolase II
MVLGLDPTEQILDGLDDLENSLGRPLVTLSYAQSLDGCIAARREVPLAISGVESSGLTHRLRASHDVILVGIGTVLADDPQLTVRLVEGLDPQPVILDSQLRFPLGANLLRDRSPWIATTPQADPQKAKILEGKGAMVVVLPSDPAGRISLPAMLKWLHRTGVNRVMVEGGGAVITSFLTERLVDYLVLTIAPLLLGGYSAIQSSLAESPGTRPARYPHLIDMAAMKLGADLIVWGCPAWTEDVSDG